MAVDVLLKSETFDYEVARSLFQDNRYLGLQLCTVYVFILFVGQRVMKSRDPLKLNYLLIGWNLALALFSIVGTLNIMPDFLSAWRDLGFRESYCKTRGYFEGNNGYWVFLFTISKIAELGDSIFLVLRKRPLIFLHWYHHATVLLYTWLAYPYEVAAIRWGMGMNFTVHAFMYTYFLLRSLKMPLPGWTARTITSMQIVQFIVGVWVTGDVAYRSFLGDKGCECPFFIAAFQLFLYVSYLVLFANFFYHSYLKPRKSHSEKMMNGAGKHE
jgi:hypothetical protein